MNHDDEHELFARLESEMTTGEAADADSADVIDLSKARSARDTASADSTNPEPNETDPTARIVVDRPGGPSGPGCLDRARNAKRRPVLPAWAKSQPEFVSAAGWFAGYTWHTAAYHAVRLPWYGLRLTAQAPRGAAQFAGGTLRWLTDREGSPVREAAVRREDVPEYLRLSQQRDRRVRWRTLVAVAASVLGVTTAMSLYVLVPGWLLAVSGAMVTLALGWLGQPEDKPVVQRAVEIPKVQKLTSDVVLRALGALGIAQINQAIGKGSDPLTFTAPITRDGPGWRAEGDLPFGVTVTDVMEKRERLASGLRRPLGCVWPEAVADEHTGHLVLWVGDKDMAKAQQPAWTLAMSGTVDLFKPVSWGTDQRGRWVDLTLMYVAGVIGAIPRMGKTYLLRLLLLIASLDPRAEIHTYDLKGTGDLDPVGEAVSYRHRAGDDEADILYALAAMRELQGEMRRRTQVIRSLPRDICPESKVTSDLADKKSLGLHPIVVGVDECQRWFEHPKHGAELEEICTDLVKRGPATGIVLLLSTQRPDDKSLPKAISSNASARWCLKVMSHLENNMVLGTGAYSRGVQATNFAWGDKGICYFLGEGADARIVRSVEVDAVVAEMIAARGRKLREEAGTLAGYARGEGSTADAVAALDVLADVRTVMGADKKVWNDVVVERLAELRPEIYGEWTADQLTSALKPFGIFTVQIGRRVDGKVVNRRGIARKSIDEAIAERDGKSDAA